MPSVTPPPDVPLRPVERLAPAHDPSTFDSGAPALDDWLRRFARSDQPAGASVTYVLCRGTRVVGFYSVAPSSVDPADTPPRVRRGQPRRPVPVLLLARLAVDRGEQRRGLGADLLRDALLRMLSAADTVGGRAVFVQAKDEQAVRFYRRFGFEPAPENPRYLFRLMKDVRASLRTARTPGA